MDEKLELALGLGVKRILGDFWILPKLYLGGGVSQLWDEDMELFEEVG